MTARIQSTVISKQKVTSDAFVNLRFGLQSAWVDASGVGWGACCNTRNRGGLWSLTETTHHINYLVTLGAFFALKCFAKEVVILVI